jgi:hypothetical protein
MLPQNLSPEKSTLSGASANLWLPNECQLMGAMTVNPPNDSEATSWHFAKA